MKSEVKKAMSLQEIVDQLANFQRQLEELRIEVRTPANADPQPRVERPPAPANVQRRAAQPAREVNYHREEEDADALEAEQIEESLNLWKLHTLAPAVRRLVEDQVGKHKTYIRKLAKCNHPKPALNDARIQEACDRLIAAISDEDYVNDRPALQ